MKKGMAALFLGTGMLAGIGLAGKNAKKKLTAARDYADKHLDLYLMMNQWVRLKQEGKSVAAYLEAKGYREIAVYGMHYIGETFVNEMKASKTAVKYAIDRNAGGIYSDLKIYLPDADLPEADAVIVTAVTFYEEIREMLEAKIACPVLSLENILYEM